MNVAHIAFAFFGATAAYFAASFVMLAALPGMKSEYLKYPGVYRPHDSMMKAMPYNMVAILVGILVAAVLYARMHPAGGSLVTGLLYGALLGIFAVCNYAVHNYTLLNIGARLTIYESLTSFVAWVIVGAAIGLIY